MPAPVARRLGSPAGADSRGTRREGARFKRPGSGSNIPAAPFQWPVRDPCGQGVFPSAAHWGVPLVVSARTGFQGAPDRPSLSQCLCHHRVSGHARQTGVAKEYGLIRFGCDATIKVVATCSETHFVEHCSKTIGWHRTSTAACDVPPRRTRNTRIQREIVFPAIAISGDPDDRCSYPGGMRALNVSTPDALFAC